MNIIDRNIIAVLKRLTEEAEQIDKLNTESSVNIEYARRSYAIKYILDKVCSDFGEKYMLDVFLKACNELGRTVNPLGYTIVKKKKNLPHAAAN